MNGLLFEFWKPLTTEGTTQKVQTTKIEENLPGKNIFDQKLPGEFKFWRKNIPKPEIPVISCFQCQ